MRIARALAIKVGLPLSMVGVTLLSGAAVAVPAIAASVNSVTVASTVTPGVTPTMHYG